MLLVPFKPSPWRIREVLVHMGMVSRRAVYKPLLRGHHKRDRLEFARQHKGWSVDQWRKVIFSDEKIFRVRPGGTVKLWIPKTAKTFDARYTIPAVQKAEGLMIWAGMNGKGKLCLRRCPPKMRSTDYQSLLGSALSFIRPRFVFLLFCIVPGTIFITG